MNRRHFLTTASALPVAFSSISSARESELAKNLRKDDLSTHYGPWVEVNRNHLTWNVHQVSSRVEGRPILAVLKANAYGHGLVGTAQHLEGLGAIRGFAVFKVEEAVSLRDSGIRKPILVLGPTSDTEMESLVRHDIMPSIYEDRSKLLGRLAAKYQKPVRVHLYVDTGLGRMGVPYYRAMPLIEALAEHKGIQFNGVLTTLTEEADFDPEQVRRLQRIYDEARQRRIDLGFRHAASSSAIFHLPEAFLDMVRPGISLYGCYPGDRAEEGLQFQLRPAMSLKARVMYVKQLRAGDSLQYHRTYMADKPIWVATLPVGYSDGWPQQTVNACSVLVRGRRYPVIASVTSNHSLIEVGSEPIVQEGDEAVLFGESEEGAIEAHEVSSVTNRSVYSLLMGVNPLLSSRYVPAPA